MQGNIKKIVARLLAITLVVVAVGVQSSTAMAASLTSMRDEMSRLETGVAANHTIQFITPTGVTAGQTITLTFNGDFTGESAIVHGDVDLATAATCTGFSDKTLGAGPSGATWGVGAASDTITITSGTDTITATHCVQIEIGTNATSQVTGSNQITNGAIDDDESITLAVGSGADTGTIAVDIITDDTVDISATVSPSITFTINDTAIGFGTLSFSAATWANAGATGSASDTSAHNLTVATNAASGYALTYNGATLTSGGNTIDGVAITDNADGTPGTEEFAIGFDVSNSSTIASGYDHNSTPGNRDWTFVPSTTTTVVSRVTPTNTETINAYYLANISATGTAAGVYNTSVTYTATATF